MGKTFVSAVALLSILVPLAGCAYTAHVRGVAGDEAVVGSVTVPSAALINVSSDPEGIAWDENPSITRKIEALLTRSGYTVTNSTEADYYLFFEFDRNSLMNRIRFEPFTGLEGGLQTTRHEGPFDLTLSLRLVRAEDYQQRGMEDYVWTGGAILSEVPTESPRFIDLLLVAAMQAFPKDTEKTIKTRVGFSDSTVRQIRRL